MNRRNLIDLVGFIFNVPMFKNLNLIIFSIIFYLKFDTIFDMMFGKNESELKTISMVVFFLMFILSFAYMLYVFSKEFDTIYAKYEFNFRLHVFYTLMLFGWILSLFSVYFILVFLVLYIAYYVSIIKYDKLYIFIKNYE